MPAPPGGVAGSGPRSHRPGVGRGVGHVRPGCLPLLEDELGRLRVESVAHLTVIEHGDANQMRIHPFPAASVTSCMTACIRISWSI